MQLSDFNTASIEDVTRLLKQLVHIDSWAHSLQQQRPYSSKEELLRVAEQQVQTWTWTEIATALATHPRIGEKQAKQVLSAKEQNFSKAEQAAVSQDEATQQALLAGNLAYEAKFDFIFLIRAAGRSSSDILDALHSRLDNDLETEKKIVHTQLAEIALLRLQQEIQA